MATGRRKRDLLSSRRRVDDDGEEGQGADDLDDDSQSEASVLTADEPNAKTGSDMSDLDRNEPPVNDTDTETKGVGKTLRTAQSPTAAVTNGESTAGPAGQVFASTADMEAMINGIKMEDSTGQADRISFEDTNEKLKPDSLRNAPRSHGQRQMNSKDRGRGRGQVEGRPQGKIGIVVPKQASNNAQASPVGTVQPPTGPSGWVNGRGRGLASNGQRHPQRPEQSFAPASNARWNHDLHEMILEPKVVESDRPARGNPKQDRPTTLSRTVAVGNVAARVLLPFMEAPILLDKKILVRQHTRLPDLRPPLRRDKPVRISLPNQAPRFVFPSTDRSFIFIPRAQRPNQQGKMRGRGHFSRGGSRRTSVHGGSGYSPSVTVSRRSSMVRDGLATPHGALFPRPPTGLSRPVVRLPGAQNTMQFVPGAPEFHHYGRNSISVISDSAYPLPTEPVRREHRSSQMTMHQPRPQKQMSVASIEGEQQAFHQQIPYVAAAPPSAEQSGPQMAPHAFNGQPDPGTPLPNIPESAINAQPFQPTGAAPPPYYGYPVQPMYYYPQPDAPPNAYAAPHMASPAYVGPTNYYMPVMAPFPRPEEANPANTFMHESNGMVFYYGNAPQHSGAEGFHQGGMLQPSQDGYLPHDMAYYTPQ